MEEIKPYGNSISVLRYGPTVPKNSVRPQLGGLLKFYRRAA
jgi:hypothetical protein